MICWTRRAHAPYNGGRFDLRLTFNASTRSSNTDAPRSARAASTRDHHALKKALSGPKTLFSASERSKRARHTLRALLRECSYLPDPAAKQYLSQHVLSRFRTYGYRAWKHRNEPGYNARLQEKEREARQTLNQLKRANIGASKSLLRILFQTYGRIGKRRHELMRPLMTGNVAEEDGEGLEGAAKNEDIRDTSTEVDRLELADIVSADIAAHGPKPRKEHTISVVQAAKSGIAIPKALPRLTPELYSLAKSQIRTSPASMTRPNPRNLKADVPKLNAKMRPMPTSRVKNMTQKWYANTLDRLLPPLPTSEWLRLQELAAGRGIQEQLAKRRKRPETSSSVPASALERILLRGTFDTPNPTTSDVHEFTPRFMQRLYAAVFGQCPRMDWDVEKERWNVTWGSQTLSRADRSAPP
ncbi:hypothetical protein DOTSEDRAFT_50487 [Dothistroma septosporum NZE10]|uniref:LYR motif-containing protein Cup1-like N-terminal domain-containing protein n=1 Tax=Dothistroma septosporum (strain NZE10 / CBS 128990) TaxID=675120 RepID=N1PX27_DOTSN|nr:hypothetical protein DOTSEDRAFT_50487 [Dothistroma septosporum NZE10]